MYDFRNVKVGVFEILAKNLKVDVFELGCVFSHIW